jgi:hypothetical protein
MSTTSIHSIIFGESNDHLLDSRNITSHAQGELSNIIFGISESKTFNEPHDHDEVPLFEGHHAHPKQTRSLSAPSIT